MELLVDTVFDAIFDDFKGFFVDYFTFFQETSQVFSFYYVSLFVLF